MARLKDQTIPADLADAYRLIFGDTYAPTRLGPTYPDLDQVARTGYTPRTPTADNPTAEQLAVRAAFTATQNELEAMPYQEKHCYYRLGLGTGMRYGDYYTHLHLADIYHEITTPEAVRRPHASCYERIYNSGWAQMVIWSATFDAVHLKFHYTGDPVTPLPPTSHLPGASYIVYEYCQIYENETYSYLYNIIHQATPAVRYWYDYETDLPERPTATYREITWTRNTADYLGESILWRFEIDGAADGTDGYQMTPSSPYA